MKRKIFLKTFAAFLSIDLLLMVGFSAYFLRQNRNVAQSEFHTITLSGLTKRIWDIATPMLQADALGSYRDSDFPDVQKAAISLLNVFAGPNVTNSLYDQYAFALYSRDRQLLFHSGQGFLCEWSTTYFEDGKQKKDSGAAFLYPEKWFSPEDVERLSSYRTLVLDSPKVGDTNDYSVTIGDFWLDGMELIPAGGIHVTPLVVRESTSDGGWSSTGYAEDIIYPVSELPQKPTMKNASPGQLVQAYTNCTILTGSRAPLYSTPERSAIIADRDRLATSLTMSASEFRTNTWTRTGLFSYQYYAVIPFQNTFYLEDTGSVSPLYLVTLTDIDLWTRCGSTLTFVWLTCLALFLITAYLLALNSWKTYQKQEAVEGRRRQITQALAHDLKTPLAMLSGCAENLLAGVHTEKREFYAQNIWEQSQELDGIIQRMLELSRLEAGEGALQFTQVSLAQLCRERLARDVALIQDKFLTCTITGDWVLPADRPLMERVIDNFFSNAFHFTPNGGTITATLQKGHFSLENSGSHIVEDQRPLIWQAYHKADPSRSDAGLGLGLYLAGEILKLHGLSFGADNTETGVQFFIVAAKPKS